ncbi:MAG: hypothetical protein FWG50_00780 [Kiritimatiellaeota bacterium]|nr:hypothetical protein [Kiritimatiellota bacterium]MCL1919605.1 hypothetical protein [Kiritimatiellota bacterium]
MKRLIILFLLSAQSVWGQNPVPDLSWTFQWGTNTAGMLFEDAALAMPVKAVIRDDIKRVYQLNPQSNATFRLYLPSEEEHGKYTGVFQFERSMACPKDIHSLDYCIYGGTNYYAITESISTIYSEKIALTNQHHAAIGSLSNFLHTVNHVSVGNTTPVEFAQMWWRFKKGRAGALADDTVESFTEGIQSMSEDRYYCLSLLSVWERPPSYWSVPSAKPLVVGCTIKALPRAGNGNSDGIEMDAVYKDGQWRFVAWE